MRMNSSMEGAWNGIECSVTEMEKPCGSNSSASDPRSCQVNGGGPGGCSRISAMVLRVRRTASEIGPPGTQAANTTRAVGLVTLAISAAAADGSSAKITPKTETTTSALAPEIGIEA